MDIYFELMNYLISPNNLIVVPNFYYKGFECDVFVVSRNMFTTEYEIKLSKQDFEADFDKKRNYYDWETRKTVYNCKKHDEIRNGKRTNRFYFVVPEKMDVDIPSYAGKIIFFERHGSVVFRIEKKARFLHKEKIKEKFFVKIANNLNWRYYKQLKRSLREV